MGASFRSFNVLGVVVNTHRFGGPWTAEKLTALRKYLEAYRRIFTANDKARYFQTIYVDAFAGTGNWQESNVARDDDNDLFAADDQPEVNDFRKGSARISLELSSPFDRYLFIDKNRSHVKQLESMVQTEFESLNPRCKFWQGDANDLLREFCTTHFDWKKWRAVVFLDPYGMSVSWNTIRLLAETKAVDLWILFPLAQGVNRLLTRQGEPPEGFANRLTEVFGTDDWRTEFYSSSAQSDLFSSENRLKKVATFDTIAEYWIAKLKNVFPGVSARPRFLRNSRGSPLFLLCFAASNAKGAKAALNIANDLLDA